MRCKEDEKEMKSNVVDWVQRVGWDWNSKKSGKECKREKNKWGNKEDKNGNK